MSTQLPGLGSLFPEDAGPAAGSPDAVNRDAQLDDLMSGLFPSVEEQLADGSFSFGGLGRSLNNPIRLAAAVGTGLLGEGLLAPLESLLSLPGLNWTGADEFLERAQINLYSATERASLRAGLTVDEIASQEAFGKFVGFILPAIASVGVVNVALKAMGAARTAQQLGTLATGVNKLARTERALNAVARYPLSNGFVNEFLGGALYGGLLVKPEEGESRLNNSLKEAAFFGLGRIVFNVPAWLGIHKLKYLMERSRTVDDVVRGADGAPTSEGLRNQAVRDDVFSAYSEIEAIESSTAAMIELVESGDNLKALAVAMREMGFNKGRNRFTINLTNDPRFNFTDTGAEMARLRASVGDDMVLQLINNPRTGLPQVFGAPRGMGLTGKQAGEIARVGFYEGQYVIADGIEGRFKRLFRGKRPGEPASASRELMELVDEFGTIHTVNGAGVRTAFTSADIVPFSKRANQLFEAFRTHTDDAFKAIFDGGQELTETQAMRLAQRGELDAGAGSFLDNQIPGTVNYPYEVGADPSGLPKAWAEARQQMTERAQEIAQQVSELAKQGDEALPLIQKLQEEGQQIGATLKLINVFTPEGAIQDIAENGFSFSRFNVAFQDIPLGSAFDDWAATLGIQGTEKLALKGSFIQKYTRDLMEQIDPVEMNQLKKVMQEYSERLLDDGEVPLDVVAMQRGYQVFMNPQRTKFVLRDRMSGAEFIRESEGEVREALRQIIRDSPDLVANNIPLGNMVIAGPASAKSAPNYIMPKAADYKFGDITENSNETILKTVNRILQEVEESSLLPVHTITNGIARKFAAGQQGAQVIRDALKEILTPVLSNRSRRRLGVKMDDVGVTWARLGNEFSPSELSQMNLDELGEAVLRLSDGNEGMVTVFKEMDRVFEIMNPRLSELPGAPTGREFMSNYYTDGLPNNIAFEVPLSASDLGRPGDEVMEWMVEHMRKGRLARSESNPLIVLDKLVETAYVTERLLPDVAALREVRDITIQQLTPEQGNIVREAARGRREITEESFAINEPLRDILDKVANHYELNGRTEYKGTVDFLNRFFKLLNIEISQGVVEQFIQTTSQLMYGATLGARLAPIVLNSIQVTALGQPLWGARHYGLGVEVGLSRFGFNRAKNAGAMIPERNRRFTEVGDDVFENLESGFRSTSDGALSNGAIGLLHGAGWVSGKLKKLGDIALTPFGHIDEVNRSIAFSGQVSIVNETIGRLGGIDEILRSPAVRAKFEEVALVGHSPVVRRQFFEQLKHFGQETAEDYIGVEGSKLINFSYGQGLGPMTMQEGWGRLFGMFGSHPVWMVNYYRNIFKNATMTQRAGIAARSAAFMGAIGVVGIEYDFNPMKFVPLSFPTWTGGPAIDILTNGLGLVRAPWSTKAATAASLLERSVPLVIPGGIAAKEVFRAWNESGGLDIDGKPNIPFMAIAMAFSRPNYRAFADYSVRDSMMRPFEVDDNFLMPETKRLLGNPAMRLTESEVGELLALRGDGTPDSGLSATTSRSLMFREETTRRRR